VCVCVCVCLFVCVCLYCILLVFTQSTALTEELADDICNPNSTRTLSLWDDCTHTFTPSQLQSLLRALQTMCTSTLDMITLTPTRRVWALHKLCVCLLLAAKGVGEECVGERADGMSFVLLFVCLFSRLL
jgi:hypothetical protein